MVLWAFSTEQACDDGVFTFPPLLLSEFLNPMRPEFGRVDVPFRVGREFVDCAELAGSGSRLAELVENFQRLPVEDIDLIVPDVCNVEMPLRTIGREGEPGGGLHLVGACPDFHFLSEYTSRCEYLNPLVASICEIDETVVRHLDRVRDVERRTAVRSPRPLERAVLRIEHDNTMVPVAVRDEQFIFEHHHISRLFDVTLVGVARTFPGMADLHQKLA